MALAGSNGGSWSTTYMPKSGVRSPPGENYVQSRDNETSIAGNSALPREFRGRLSVAGNSSRGFGSGDRISIPPGHKLIQRIHFDFSLLCVRFSIMIYFY